ncbi:hypothetical protein CUN67_25145 (plasmid) [Pantoea cypripedii]|uniref:Uncharacterized protein n=2 Tax=Pantoea cypripedii TaxID=55209 RepID=A0A6B9G3S4_PANCY|nr:hypothetical protein CUN67_25145 [Pantoea cypripedii]
MNIFPVSVPHFSSITLANDDGTAADLPSSITSVTPACLQPETNTNILQPRVEVLNFARNHNPAACAGVIKSSWQKFDYEKNSLNRLILTLLHDDVQALRLERTGQLRESIVNAQIPVDPVSLTSVLIQYAKNFPPALREWFPQAWQSVRYREATNWEKLMTLLETKDSLDITRLALSYMLNIHGERRYSYELVSRALSASYAIPPLPLTLWINHTLKNAPGSDDSRTKWLGMHLRAASGLPLSQISSFQLIKGLWDAGIKLDFNQVDHALTAANLDIPQAESDRFRQAWLVFKPGYQPVKLTRKRRVNASRPPRARPVAPPPQQCIDRAMLSTFLNRTELTFINSWEKLMCCLWDAGEDPSHITLYRLFRCRASAPLPPENTLAHLPTGGGIVPPEQSEPVWPDLEWQDIILPPLSGYEEFDDMAPGS